MTATDAVLAEARASLRAGDHGRARALWRDLIARDLLDPGELERVGKALARLPSTGEATRVVVLGQCTTSYLLPVLSAVSWGQGLALTVEEGAYDQVLQELHTRPLDRATVVLIPWSSRLVAQADLRGAIDAELDFWRNAWAVARARGAAHIIQVGYDAVLTGPQGPHLAARAGGVLSAVDTLNREMLAALDDKGYYLDLSRVAGDLGRSSFYEPRQYGWTRQPFSGAGLVELARALAAAIRALTTGPKKVLVLDLDNTLWGGVVGEVGARGVSLGDSPDGFAFRALQTYVAGLAKRGVVLAVCSKNNRADAEGPFREHPDMVLRLEDIAAFEASWDPKPVALVRIAQTLSLGLDSFVFLDDNPAEREAVRQALPEVAVVDVPLEPAELVRCLDRGRWFDTVAVTDEDRQRTQAYAAERLRTELRTSSGSIEDFLGSLDMAATRRVIDDVDMPRVVQLLAKTNQWNLTTRRHGEAAVRALLARAGAVGWSLRVRDRFGDHGLVALILAAAAADDAQTLHIDSWLMSCRVIGRRIEQAFFDALVIAAKERGYARIRADYIPTKKNELVQGLLAELGFHHVAHTAWELEVSRWAPPATFLRWE